MVISRYHGATISPHEAADALGVTPQTIYNWLRDGEVPGYKVGKRLWRIPREEFEQRFGAILRLERA